MYRHILLPVSFEDDRNTAEAVTIASKLLGDDGKVTMLHVMEEVPSYVVNYVPEGFHERAKEAIVQSLSDLAGKLGNVESVVVDGHSGRTILQWADTNQVDLIIIASHRPGVADYLLGGTAAQVVRHAKCAVHVVR